MQYKMQSRIVWLGIGFMLIPPFILAQSVKSKHEENKLETILVSGEKGNKTPYDENHLKTYVSSGSYSYLGKSDIDTFRGSSVGDFLSGVPGVIVGNKRNSGALSVNIRGIANENRVPVYVDNGLQSVPSWQGYAGSSTRTYLDPDFISQVEIEKGPSFAEDATGAVGGVVRMNTLGWKDIISEGRSWGILLKLGTMTNTVSSPNNYTKGGYQTRYISQCLTNDSGLCQTQTYSPNARYSSNGLNFNSYNYSIAFANKWANADVVFAYAKRNQGNYFVGKHGQTPEIDRIEVEENQDYAEINGEYETVEVSKVHFRDNHSTLYRAGEEALNTSQFNKSYLVKTNFYNDHHKFGLSYNHYHSRFGEIMSSILSFRGYGALQGEGSEIKVDRYSLNYQYTPNSPYIKVNISAYYTHSDSSNFTPYLDSFGYDYSQRHAHFLISKQKGLSIDNTSIFQLNNKPLSIKYGITHSYERIYPPRDAQARVLSKGYPDDAIAPGYVRNGKRKEMSSFINLSYPFNDWLKADSGVRYIRSTTYDYVSGPDIYDPAIFHHQFPIKNKGFSPITMLSAEVAKGTTVYAKYAQALRSPSLFQATKGWSMSNTSDSLEKLKPERAKNWEFGVNGLYENIGGQDNVIGLKLAYFNNNIANYLTRSLDKESGKTQTVNLQRAKMEGLEVSAYYDMRMFYAKFSGTYYTKTQYCLMPHQVGNSDDQCYDGYVYASNINNTVPPKLQYQLILGTRWLDEKLDIGVRYSYHGKRVVPVLRDDTSSIDWAAYSLVDIYANYSVSHNLKLTMTMDNTFNRYYLDTNNMGLNTAPGRTLHLGLEYRF
ncbi:MAG: TonB-dependent receptor [Lonepinella koalarum]|nr:TonB-dependent receptor [Lonepinella koalarum]